MGRGHLVRRSDVGALLTRQLGLARREQLLGGGVAEGMLRWRLERRQWVAVLPSVYATFTGSLTPEQHLIAALLYAGDASQVTGPRALRAHGLRYVPEDTRVRVLVPRECRRASREFVVIIRTDRLQPPVALGAIRYAPVARAVADTCRELSALRPVRALVAEAVQRRLVGVQDLCAEVEQGPRRGSRLLRMAVDELGDGVRSVAEAELRVALAGSVWLRGAHWNPRLRDADGVRLPTPDCWIDEVGVAIEVDSREYHTSPEDWSMTLDRHNRLTACGAVVLHLTPQRIRRDPLGVRRAIERTCDDRRTAGVRAPISMIMGPFTP